MPGLEVSHNRAGTRHLSQRHMTRKTGLLILFCGLLFSASLAISKGAFQIPAGRLLDWLTGSPGALDAVSTNVLISIRLPRVLLGLIAGASLGSAGAAMQALFRNPLAEPGLVGLSAGASLGAITAIVLTPGGFLLIAAFAFTGSVITTQLAFVLGKKSRGMSGLLLAGVAINTIAFSLMGLIIISADDTQLRDLTFWSMGSLAGASWPVLAYLGPWVLLGVVVVMGRWRVLNALLLGEREAQHLGYAIHAIRRQIIALVALTVGPVVAVTGGIGFVGLVMPHLVRMWLGADHRWVLPASALAGALGLTLADVLARVVIAPAELPIGLVTSLVGGPFFVWMLLQGRAR